MVNIERKTKEPEIHSMVESALESLKTGKAKDVSKIDMCLKTGETVEHQCYDNGSIQMLIYRDLDGDLTRIVDFDLEKRVNRLRLFDKNVLTEVKGFDEEGDINQIAKWNNGVFWELYNIRKDKSVESQSVFVHIEDEEKCLAVYETTIFDESQKEVEKYCEVEKLVFSEDMNVWMME